MLSTPIIALIASVIVIIVIIIIVVIVVEVNKSSTSATTTTGGTDTTVVTPTVDYTKVVGGPICGLDGETCALTGTNQVQYGAPGNFIVKSLSGPVVCNKATFGGTDPAPNVYKQCRVVTSGYTAPGAVTDITGFTQCAAEGQPCTITNGPQTVVYGASGHYLVDSFNEAAVACGKSAFGSDPAPNVVKFCYVK